MTCCSRGKGKREVAVPGTGRRAGGALPQGHLTKWCFHWARRNMTVQGRKKGPRDPPETATSPFSDGLALRAVHGRKSVCSQVATGEGI